MVSGVELLAAWRSRSAVATEALGRVLGERLFAGSLVALRGDLGSGKTCLTRGIAAGLGIAEGVASPTYALMATHHGRLPLYHFDAWMEGREKAFFAEGGGLWLEEEGVAVVEWAERVAAWLPEPYLELELVHEGPTDRLLLARLRGGGGRMEAYRGLLAALPPLPGLERVLLPGGIPGGNEPGAATTVGGGG